MRAPVLDSVETMRAEIERCAKCGECKAVCPVFGEDNREGSAARGKIALSEALLSGELTMSARLEEYLSACLVCTRCRDVCASDVDYVQLIHGIRSMFPGRSGFGLFARTAMRAMLPRRGLLDVTVGIASRVQRTASKTPLRHLPMMVLGKLPLPTPAQRTALSEFGARRKPGTKGRVFFFTGCLINFVYTGIARAFIRVAERAGYEVVADPAQLCCGTPALSLGDIKLAGTLARRNLARFVAEDYDFIVTACASCARTLVKEYPLLLRDRYAAVEGRILDATQFLADHCDVGAGRTERTVTYHDPCHLYYGIGVREAPRTLLDAHARFTALDDGGACCGLGGVFAVMFPEMARSIGLARIETVRATGVEVVTSACPGCMMQLESCARAAEVPVEVRHVVEIVADSL